MSVLPSEQIDAAVKATTVNNLNQVTGLSPSGPIRFEGAMNEAGTLSVAGKAADVAGDNSFKVDVPLTAGTTTTVAVVGTDAASNVKTDHYDVPVSSGSSRTLAYDLNGNMTNNGNGQTYEWDSADRMTKITYTGGARTEFAYDGQGRRMKILEKNSGGSTTSEKRFVWDGLAIAEERDGSNVLQKRFYDQGLMVSSSKFFYSKDHLGSIRELTDNSGAVEARYDYDPYGRITKVSGSGDADFRYTGHYLHASSGLHLAPYRAYDTDLGRWLSRDLIFETGGINLYAYLGTNPLNYFDPTGLDAVFTMTDGSQKRVQTVSDFVNTAQAAKAESIQDISFPRTHGNSMTQTIGRESTSQQVIKVAGSGRVMVTVDDGRYNNSHDLGGLLQGKLAGKATMNLTSCETAKGEDNLAKRISTTLPNVLVTGNTEKSIGIAYTDVTFFGNPRTYKNGSIQEQK